MKPEDEIPDEDLILHDDAPVSEDKSEDKSETKSEAKSEAFIDKSRVREDKDIDNVADRKENAQFVILKEPVKPVRNISRDEFLSTIESATEDYKSPIKPKVKPTSKIAANKEALIDDIIKLSEKLNLEYDKEILEKQKVSELKKQLADLVLRGAETVRVSNIVKTELELGSKALGRFYVTLLRGLEELSMHGEEVLGSNLAGVTAMAEKNKEELEEILGKIYMENKISIDPLIKPINRLIIITLQMLATAFVKNKKKISEPKLTDSYST